VSRAWGRRSHAAQPEQGVRQRGRQGFTAIDRVRVRPPPRHTPAPSFPLFWVQRNIFSANDPILKNDILSPPSPPTPTRSPDSLAAQCSFDCDEDAETCDVCSFTPEFCYRAGPRGSIYFEPTEVHAAIVNCGGLCPGINDVVRSVVNTLEVGYGVKNISGIRFGWGGFWRDGATNMPLTRRNTSGVQVRLFCSSRRVGY
jgi:hypothetical protein